MPRSLHLHRDLSNRADGIANVVEPFPSLLKPVGTDARAVKRLDQLVLRAALVEHEPQRPFGRSPAILAPLGPLGGFSR